MSDGRDEREPNVLGVIVAGVSGAIVLGVAYVRFRNGFTVGTLEAHAAIGNALAPVVAFLTLMAVVAALWSVQVQRTELALQRRELRETREEMVEQRKQFEKTARAQEALAKAQQESAEAQRRANQLAVQAMRMSLGEQSAQRANTRAVLAGAIASVSATITRSRRDLVATPGAIEKLEAHVTGLAAILNEEVQAIEGINDILESDSELERA